ncbi:MAG: M13 family metallopeptidase, partial [Pseudomonadota bacterium]
MTKLLRKGDFLRRGAAIFSFAIAATSVAAAHDDADQTPLIEPWGYPFEAFDRDVDPGDDFYRFANGGWLDATEIPSDRSAIGFSTDMRDRNEDRIAAIIADLAASNVRRGTDEQLIRDLYRSFMDQNRIEKRGLKPIEKDLKRVARIETHAEAAALMAEPALGLDGPFGASVWIDSKNPDSYTVWVGHSGLGLPDKSYFKRDTKRMNEMRNAYRTHIGRMLSLAGVEDADAKASAVFELEKSIAALHWDRAARRDANRTYNAMDRTALEALAPGFPWAEYFAAAGVGDRNEFVVREKDAFPGLAALFAETPVDVWRDYLTLQLINSFSSYLPKEIDDASFEFYGKTLRGQQEQRTREKRGINLVNGQLDQAVGKIYIERYFPEESKRQMTEMFENIRSALRTRIENLTWMSPQTKTAALVKLNKMTAKIAYPDKWREYSGLTIRAGDLVGNVKRVREFDAARDIARLGEPVDKAEWFTGPQTVNAFYSPTRNEAFMPAGYIQSPLFDPYADPALNYGAIGSIVGHEIGHGFDDQGSKYDGDGVL